MRLSIITITLNSENTIRDTLNSVMSQTYKDIEHIIVDGGSIDQTSSIIKRYPFPNKKIYIKKNFGIYKSINYGIKKAKGKYIMILNSDDILYSERTISDLMKKIIIYKNTEIFLGNVSYFNEFNYDYIKRYYSSKNFKLWHMKFGLMPPHPSSIISKKAYDENGLYNENFKIAGDFDIFLRFLVLKKLNFKILNMDVVRMRTGGVSGKNLFSYWISTIEILRSYKLNKTSTNIFYILMRIPAKISQLIILNQKKLNKKFGLFKILFEKKFYYQNSFKIVKNIDKFKEKDNFILSGMNLAFLGYYSNKEVYPTQNLFHWPDGIWAQKHTRYKKIPGRELIKNLKISKNIKKILVLGNLSEKSKKYLKKRFKKLDIENIKLPFGSIEKIIKKKIVLSKNQLTFITLPTPKQEKLAYFLSKNNYEYKIICIGASISIASGEEKQVPKIIKNYEFLWRLRREFFRRTKRLIETFVYYFIGKYFKQIYDKIRFIEID